MSQIAFDDSYFKSSVWGGGGGSYGLALYTLVKPNSNLKLVLSSYVWRILISRTFSWLTTYTHYYMTLLYITTDKTVIY